MLDQRGASFAYFFKNACFYTRAARTAPRERLARLSAGYPSRSGGEAPETFFVASDVIRPR